MSIPPQHLKVATAHLRNSDPVLKDIIQQVGPCRMTVKRNRYLTLVQSIVSQQISGAAARTILARLNDLVAPHAVAPETVIRLDLEQLRAVGISRQKASYVLDLTQKVASGQVNLRRLSRISNDEVVVELTKIKGIGVWTAHMFLIFSLGRLDVLPLGDLGIQNAIQRNYRLRGRPDPKKMKKIAQPWQPYESVASWYMWQSLEL
jgi:DNA-3-methyladenine glycosylase II